MTKKPRVNREKVQLRDAARSTSPGSWSCPKCDRSFRRQNQRHTCGTGDRAEVIRNRPDAVVRTYDAIVAFVHCLGAVEIVARERYALLRTVRIFADLVVATAAVRVAIHLGREVNNPMFSKVVRDRKQVTHVANLLTEQDVEPIKVYLKEAYDFSLSPAQELTRPSTDDSRTDAVSRCLDACDLHLQREERTVKVAVKRAVQAPCRRPKQGPHGPSGFFYQRVVRYSYYRNSFKHLPDTRSPRPRQLPTEIKIGCLLTRWCRHYCMRGQATDDLSASA